jgi:hypothetical protein
MTTIRYKGRKRAAPLNDQIKALEKMPDKDIDYSDIPSVEQAPERLRFDNDAIRRQIAADPDDEPSAGNIPETYPGHVPPRPLPPRDPIWDRDLTSAPPPPKPKVAWPKKKQHPRDRINEQLRTKAPRTREVKHLSVGKPREERIAILVDIGRKRGTGVLLTEIETHERKIADLREAVRQLTEE